MSEEPFLEVPRPPGAPVTEPQYLPMPPIELPRMAPMVAGMTLTEFLAARLDEDEALALDAMSSRWEVRGRSVYVADGPPSLSPVAPDAWGYAPHIARHDPARALREVAAGRAILALHHPASPASGNLDAPHDPFCVECDAEAWPCPTVRYLAAIDSGHPDYDPAWAPAT